MSDTPTSSTATSPSTEYVTTPNIKRELFSWYGDDDREKEALDANIGDPNAVASLDDLAKVSKTFAKLLTDLDKFIIRKNEEKTVLEECAEDMKEQIVELRHELDNWRREMDRIEQENEALLEQNAR